MIRFDFIMNRIFKIRNFLWIDNKDQMALPSLGTSTHH